MHQTIRSPNALCLGGGQLLDWFCIHLSEIDRSAYRCHRGYLGAAQRAL